MKVKNAKRLAGVLLLGSLAFTGVADAQLKAIRTQTNITPAERKQGDEAHPQLVAEFGGAFNGPQAAYVNRIGQNIAVQSGLSRSPRDFTVTLLNSPVNNAFAIPGGYVYVTRQLMALMNDEAELAGVLGHEVGHVAAQHSKKRQSAATRNQILGVLGAVLGSAIGDNGGLLGGLGGLLQNNAMQGLVATRSAGSDLRAGTHAARTGAADSQDGVDHPLESIADHAGYVEGRGRGAGIAPSGGAAAPRSTWNHQQSDGAPSLSATGVGGAAAAQQPNLDEMLIAPGGRATPPRLIALVKSRIARFATASAQRATPPVGISQAFRPPV